MSAKKILCTLGPASLEPAVITALDSRGVDLFRINLSHTPAAEVAQTIDLVRRHSQVPICLDTEGAQVRCGAMGPGVVLVEGRAITLVPGDGLGSEDRIALRPTSIFDDLEPDTVVRIDFDGAALRVTAAGTDGVEAVVTTGGRVGANKAVVIDPPPPMPSLSERDLEAIEIGTRAGIRHFALSFANEADDVEHMRGLLPPDAHLIAKIESRLGVTNADPITAAADAVLIDRGDLSREVPLEHVPVYQKHIIRCANALNTPVYVATNLLESMIVSRNPTLAEANDIFNTLYDGAHGLVLAAETAIGEHPVRSVDAVLRMLDAFERSTARPIFGERRAESRAGKGTADG
ncbi:MAG: pyruvate kinase [Actinomycetota bacterium]|nr:pyruvate kinase [Actinomycetota bacterium]